MALLLFTGLVLLAVSLAYIYLKRRYTSTNNDLLGAKLQILFGNLLNSGLLTGKITFHQLMREYQCLYGDKLMYWFGSQPCVAFCLPEHAQTIFSDRHTFEQSPLFLPNFDLICPNNITVLSGAKWKRHSRVMSPAFKRAKMIQLSNVLIVLLICI